jgi:D-glycero-alpha-D-manno-heptose-7-phosphate kinase
MNEDFRSVPLGASREEVLKLLYLGCHVIPRLVSNGRLVDSITPEYDLASPEAPVLKRAPAAEQVSFSGGFSGDAYYCSVGSPDATLSTATTLHRHATLVPRADKSINIHLEGLGTHLL